MSTGVFALGEAFDEEIRNARASYLYVPLSENRLGLAMILTTFLAECLGAIEIASLRSHCVA